jgi:hypothetical protein
MRSRLKASVAVVTCVSLTFGCGGSAKSAEEIAAALRTAAENKQARMETTCSALDAYSSNAAQAFPDLLRSFAQQNNLEQSTIDDLMSASDGIEASQMASDVISKLNC